MGQEIPNAESNTAGCAKLLKQSLKKYLKRYYPIKTLPIETLPIKTLPIVTLPNDTVSIITIIR
jgi:hypothetical protein